MPLRTSHPCSGSSCRDSAPLSLAQVAGFINPQEKVNGLWLVVAAACMYVWTYLADQQAARAAGGAAERRCSVFKWVREDC
jgi:hypothetical protein